MEVSNDLSFGLPPNHPEDRIREVVVQHTNHQNMVAQKELLIIINGTFQLELTLLHTTSLEQFLNM